MKATRIDYYLLVILTTLLIPVVGGISVSFAATSSINYDSSIYSADIEQDFEEVEIKDDWEPFNRAVFQLNKGLDTIFFKPVAKTYRFITPTFVREGASNFLNNLSEPVYFANFVLQGNPDQASNTLGRFLVNSTLGIGGIIDVSSEAGLQKTYTDFGLTLGHWGLETGNYLVLPVIGSSSLRDITGRAVDIAMDPLTYIVHYDFNVSRGISQFIVNREAVLDFTDDLEQTTLDEYSSIRSIYFQKREVKK